MVACMDGADYITRLRVVNSELRRHDGSELPKAGERHPIMKQFVAACEILGLPINVGKKVVQDFNGVILGGELDGVRGSLGVAPDKGHKFVGKTCALLSVPKATQVACQHWSGLYCVAAGFRRPLFSVLEEIFSFIVKMDDSKLSEEPLPNAVRDEVLLAGLLMPLATTNLRAPLREKMSISDASEFGGASAEASHFVAATDPKIQKLANERDMTLLEEGSQQVEGKRTPLAAALGENGQTDLNHPIGDATVDTPTGETTERIMPRIGTGRGASSNLEQRNTSAAAGLHSKVLGRNCGRCSSSMPADLASCPLGCPEQLCSAECYLRHRRSCAHASLECQKVLILSRQKEKNLVFALISNGLSVDLEKPGRKKTPDAALVIALNRGCDIKDALQQSDALQNQRIEGRLAILWCGVGSKVWALKPARLMEKSIDTLKTKYKSFQLLHNLPARSFSLLESQKSPGHA